MRVWVRIFLVGMALGAVLAAQTATLKSSPLRGLVRDALGRPVAGATVTLLDAGGQVLAQASTDGGGRYALAVPAGAVTITASHAGLAPATDALSAALGAAAPVLILPLATVQTAVNVTALAVPLPAAQVGNTTSTLDSGQLSAMQPVQAAGALRQLPGLGVVQSGQMGGVTSVFLRGAPAEFTKVLLDGVPIQRLDLGGYDFSNLMAAGVDQIQVLRGPDSVIYGSDAAAGVIALQTRRGDQVPAPELDGSTEAGAYGTVLQSDSLLGQWRPFDYAFRYAYLDTHNQQPNAKFRNNTYGANLGWHVGSGAVVRFQLQRSFSDSGQPNAVDFYGVTQGAFKHQGETYGAVTWEQQITPGWSERLSLSQAAANLFSELPGPVGVPDGFGDYDGLPVTITGANGYQVHGSALLSFGAFPQISPSDTLRRGVDWSSQLSLGPAWSLLAGYRYDDERGLSATDAFSRHDNGAYAALAGGLWNRLFVNGGVSFDRDTPFGNTTNPQASAAFYLRRAAGGFWDETRVRASAGTALKDPSLDDQAYSLYQELVSTPGGDAAAARLGVTPVRPERARDWDAGLDQYFAHGHGLLAVTWFDQHYDDLIEDIPVTAFPALGIPAGAAALAPYGGEFNSLTQRARGLELEARLRGGVRTRWRLDASYTATAALVLRSYSFDAQSPAFNPAFPGIAIGAYAPLVGQRPFRVPPQSASVALTTIRGGFTSNLSATTMSRRNDSTFLTDSSFGNTLLLPNRNLDPAVTLVNWAGSVRISANWEITAAIDNLFNRHDQQVIGYIAPGVTTRLGVHWEWSPGAKIF